MKQNSIIHVEDLSIGYGDNTIMKNLTFDVQKGDIFYHYGRIRLWQKYFATNFNGVDSTSKWKDLYSRY